MCWLYCIRKFFNGRDGSPHPSIRTAFANNKIHLKEKEGPTWDTSPGASLNSFTCIMHLQCRKQTTFWTSLIQMSWLFMTSFTNKMDDFERFISLFFKVCKKRSLKFYLFYWFNVSMKLFKGVAYEHVFRGLFFGSPIFSLMDSILKTSAKLFFHLFINRKNTVWMKQ